MSDAVTDPRDELRLRPIDRHQKLPLTLDAAIPDDHDVRVIEAFTCRVDCSKLDAAILSRIGRPGTPAYDPRLLFTLCLYATIRGLFSFRDLSESCERDLPFMWLCGGPAPSYHTLSSFYSENGDFLDQMLVDMLEALREQKLVTFEELTVDGRKVPANASKETMHRVKTLTTHRQEAEERVARLKAEQAAKGGEGSRREKAQRYAAEAKLRAMDAAVKMVGTRTQEREEGRGDPAEARASETDVDTRKMKMSDGGYRPAFNVQTVAETQSGLIVAVDVVDQASDNGLAAEMVEQAEEATQVKAKRALMDAGYSSAADVETLEKAGTEVFMPVKNAKKEKEAGKDPYAPKRRDSKPVAGWRQRMGLESTRAIYKRRGPVAEGVHAQQSNRGFKRFRLRGLVKVRIECLWHALAYNLSIVWKKKWLSEGTVRPVAV